MTMPTDTEGTLSFQVFVTDEEGLISNRLSGNFGVIAAEIQSLTISPANPSVEQGLAITLTVTGKMSDGTDAPSTVLANVVWSSSHPEYATVPAGTAESISVLGVEPGTTTITARVGSISATQELTVISPPPPVLQSLTILPVNPSVEQGLSITLTAIGTMSDGSDAPSTILANVAWSSSHPEYATVPAGTAESISVLGVEPGTTTITASIGSIITTQELTVISPPDSMGLVYALTQNAPLVAGFRVDSDGMLTELTGSPFDVTDSAGMQLMTFTAHPDGYRLYFGYRSGLPSRLASAAVDKTTGVVTMGTDGMDYASNIPRMAAHPGGQFLYVVHYDGSELYIDRIDLDGQGALTTCTLAATIPESTAGQVDNRGMIFNADGTMLYLITQDSFIPGQTTMFHIRVFSVDEAGNLTLSQTVTSGLRLQNAIALDSTGRFLVNAAWDRDTYDDFLLVYPVAAGGTLGLPTSLNIGRVRPPTVIRAAAGHIYVGWSDYSDAGLTVYSIDSETGALSLVASCTEFNFADFSVSEDGAYVFSNTYGDYAGGDNVRTHYFDAAAATIEQVDTRKSRVRQPYWFSTFIPVNSQFE
ncbi:MAG TPA: Ig-like domain-containing protein [Deltaproteobacteria bacterium]|jgi:6-phosphogluconolactonase (cycloisomerase 2 family)|nr:Ig-like domain-containing protein [Deltaproteobacteria bacterium]